MTTFISNFDIICLSETKLYNIPADEFSKFDIFSLKQKSSLHGLSVLIRSGLFPYTKKLNISKSKCILFILVGYSNSDFAFIVGSVYIPGEGSKFSDKNDYDIICEDITTLCTKFDCPIILIGDFNSRSGKLCDFYDPLENSSVYQQKKDLEASGIVTERHNCDKKVDTHGRNLIKLCRDLNLKIVNGRFGSDKGVGEFTCIKPTGKSVVDYCVVSDFLLPSISSFNIEPFDCCMSDVHVPITMDLKISKQEKNIPKTPNEKWENIKFKSTWKPESKADFQNCFEVNNIRQLSEQILNHQISVNTTQEDIDKLTLDLASIILEPAKQVGLCKKIKNKNSIPRKNPHKNWFSGDCENKRKIYLNSKNSIRKAKNQEEKERCFNLTKQKGKEYKMFISNRQKTFNSDLHKNLRGLKRQHPKEYWKIFKNSEGPQKNVPKLAMADTKNHFKMLNEEKKDSHIPKFDPRKITHSINQEINKEFTVEEVVENIKVLKNNKAEGVDFIKNEYIKNCPQNVIKLIVMLFNLILKTGFVPYDWCIGIIIPIFKKKGSPQDPKNYRGVTLLSCLGKLFTSCVNTRLTKYVNSRGIIGEEQAGFRDGYSTQEPIFVLNELINIYLQNKKRLYCCYIDYKTAFDTINRSALWGKLIANEINGPILTVIYNMYEKAKSCVKQQTMVSGLFACNVGVRQGENLSPLLFSIFLNDFELSLSRKYKGLTTINSLSKILGNEDIEFFINMYTLLYADDTLILAESPVELQLAMDEVSVYCNTWELTINSTKTKVVIFSRGKVKKQYSFKIGNIDIETCSQYCYLGVVFNFNGKFTKAILERITPARKAMFGLNAKALSLQLPPDIHIDLFEKMVTPIFLYGCEVWGYGNIEPLEVFYRKFIKRVLGLNKSTPNCIVYGEVGKRPLVNQIYLRMLAFWIRVSEGKSSKLSCIIYNLIYKLHLNGTYDSPWLLCIKRLLCHSGNPNFWINQENLAPKDFMKNIISQQLENQYLQEWHFEVNRNRKCIVYRIIKEKVSLEPYLEKLNFIERRYLCKFRTGNHKLPITESRYVEGGGGVDVTCKLCNDNDVCDEYHVLFVCKHFEEQRIKYLKKYFYNKPSTFKMFLLFNSNLKQISNLAKFSKCIMSQF